MCDIFTCMCAGGQVLWSTHRSPKAIFRRELFHLVEGGSFLFLLYWYSGLVGLPASGRVSCLYFLSCLCICLSNVAFWDWTQVTSLQGNPFYLPRHFTSPLQKPKYSWPLTWLSVSVPQKVCIKTPKLLSTVEISMIRVGPSCWD